MMDVVRRSSTRPRRQPGLRLSLLSTIWRILQYYFYRASARWQSDIGNGLQSVCQYVFLSSYPNFFFIAR